MCSLSQCAHCCIFYSISGFIFLIIMGILLDEQPDYIKGPEDPAKAAEGCYYGAVIYLCTCLLSAGYYYYDQKKKRSTFSEWNRGEGEAAALRPASPAPGYGSTAR